MLWVTGGPRGDRWQKKDSKIKGRKGGEVVAKQRELKE